MPNGVITKVGSAIDIDGPAMSGRSWHEHCFTKFELTKADDGKSCTIHTDIMTMDICVVADAQSKVMTIDTVAAATPTDNDDLYTKVQALM